MAEYQSKDLELTHVACGGAIWEVPEHARQDCMCSIDDCQRHVICLKCNTFFDILPSEPSIKK